MVDNHSVKRKMIGLLSNVTVDLIIGRLRKKYDFYQPQGFDGWVQEVLNKKSGLYTYGLDAIILLLDGTEARRWKDFEEGFERINLWKKALNELVGIKKNVPIFVSTVDIRENRIKSLSEKRIKYELQNEWYQFVQTLVEHNNNVYVVDIADLIADIGRNHFYSNKMWYMSSMPYSRQGLIAICEEIENVLSSFFVVRKKVIALDLDNTIWGGVIGEDGLDGIELSDHKEGQRYYDFQRQILEMKKRGVVLGIVSKNNQDDAERALNSHPYMLLRDDDFVSKKINWDDKATNLKEMESELNITENGFVFIDDNPLERGTVKEECAEMTVPDFPEDSTELLWFAEDMWNKYFRPLRVMSEDTYRTEMYQSEAKRNEEKHLSLSLVDYIKKLEISVDIHKMKDSEKERTVQLMNKTNQFNLTTKRYTMIDIENIIADKNNSVYVVYSADKYGDSGLVSVVILKEDFESVFIDTFLMSCRVMGRKLEDAIINKLASKYNKKIVGEYKPSAKNAPVKELYDRLGFELVSETSEHKIYELIPEAYKRIDDSCFKSISFEN